MAASYWSGGTTGIALNASTPVIETVIVRHGATELWYGVQNDANAALDAFQIEVQPRVDAAWHIVASAAADFIPTTASDVIYPVKRANIDLASLAKSTNGIVILAVKGAYAFRFSASGASSDTNLTTSWSQR